MDFGKALSVIVGLLFFGVLIFAFGDLALCTLGRSKLVIDEYLSLMLLYLPNFYLVIRVVAGITGGIWLFKFISKKANGE